MHSLILAFKRDRWLMGAAFYLGILGLLAILVPLIPGLDPNTFDPNTLLRPYPPSFSHLLGTDDLNRDVLLRSLYGARISLMVGLVSISISVIIGTFYGLISGYIGGRVDGVMMRFVDVMMAIPSIFLILSLQLVLGPSMVTVVLVIGVTSWMGIARMVRAEVMSVKERLFVTAARARGLSTRILLIRTILPHTLSPVIVSATLGVGSAILAESVLSFLGLGVQPPHASWGNMLENSLAFMSDAPWLAIAPGVLITATVLAFNFVGEGVQTYFRPKS